MRKLAGVVCLVVLGVGCDSGSAGPSEPGEELSDARVSDAADVRSDGGREGDGGRDDADASRGEDASEGDGAVNCEADGQPELCDGIDNDCDPTTADGSGDPGVDQACDGPDGDMCSEGKTACSDGKITCGDTSADTSEVCDGLDNDCDGASDETCATASFDVRDFAVRGDGASVAVGAVVSGPMQNKVQMMCFAPDGSIVRDAFEVAGPALPSHNLLSMAVARARVSGNVTVAYTYRLLAGAPTYAQDWLNYVAFFDANCQPIGTPKLMDSDLPATGVNRRWSLAMTDDGRSYVLYEADEAQKKTRALVFDATGARTTAVTLVADGARAGSECYGGGWPANLALNQVTGDFAVFCETSTTRKFRRYTAAGMPRDVAMLAVPNSQPSDFSAHFWGTAGARNGAMLYFGRVSSDPTNTWILRLYGADGQLTQSTQLGGTTGGGAPRAEVTSQGSFLIELAGPDYTLALVDPSGAVVRGWSVPPGVTYRLDGEDNVYVIKDNGIVRSPIVSLR